MTDWIEHTTDTCPVDPETVVEVRWVGSGTAASRPLPAIYVAWKGGWVSHYRIFISAKPPEPEMTRRYDDAEAYAERRVRPEMNADAAAALKRQLADAYRAGGEVQALKASVRADPEPDLITLRLECLKLAGKAVRGVCPPGVYPAADDWTEFADALLHYVLNGSVDKA
jgi:hypothetical protein